MMMRCYVDTVPLGSTQLLYGSLLETRTAISDDNFVGREVCKGGFEDDSPP